MLDVGANIGKFALLASVGRGCFVIALEPFGPNFDRLLENIELNQPGVRMVAIQIAAAAKTGSAKLKFQERIAGMARQHVMNVDADVSDMVSVEPVELVEIDHLLANSNLPWPSFVKIDVDGFESDVVAGMSHLIDTHPPRTIMIEVMEKSSENLKMINSLIDRGYEVSVGDNEKNLFFNFR
jgi:FkbM family methyltransferase